MSTIFKASYATLKNVRRSHVSLAQVLRERITKDSKIAELLKEMAQLYHFVDEFQTNPGMHMTLKNVMVRILKQTVNCGLFLQEFLEIGFTGELLVSLFCTSNLIMMNVLYRTCRAVAG